MILAEKRALIEKKNYQNMVIQLKKQNNLKLNWKKNKFIFEKVRYKKKWHKPKMWRYLCKRRRRVFKRNRIPKGRIFFLRKRRSKNKRFTKQINFRLLIKRKGYLTRSRRLKLSRAINYKYVIFEKSKNIRQLNFISKSRIDYIRIKKFVFRSSKFVRRTIYRKFFRHKFRLLLNRLIQGKSGYSHKLFKFYSVYGLYRFCISLIKFSKLKRKLFLQRKKFNPYFKNTFVIRSLPFDRIEKISMLKNFTNLICSVGESKLAFNILQKTLSLLKFRYKSKFLYVYFSCLDRIRPLVNYRTLYIGGKKYKIPTLMPLTRSYKIAARWLVKNSGKGSIYISMYNSICGAIIDKGPLIKYRKDYHALSFDNKTYIHFLKFLRKGF